ncbi:MAG: hypothetical protein A2X94_13375 [Bdellovibrionales bacterium GWB1_55_8]|nr:MAG: hypothetical protein A2X94_13375 [Bdellovibrionales bacterium GWB1_55_8]
MLNRWTKAVGIGSSRLKRTWIGALIVLVCAFCRPPWQDASAGHSPIAEENERIFEVILNDGTPLSEGILGYQVSGGWLLPIGELSVALGFGINVSPSLGLAEGFIITEERRLRIDLKACTAEIHGQVRSFRAPDGSCNGAYTTAEDLLIEAQHWSQWFPLELVVDSFRSRIIITPKETLPIQRKKMRADLPGNVRAGSASDPGYPEIPDRVSPLSGPFLDQQLSLQRVANKANTADDFQSDTVLSSEILGWETRAFASLGKSASKSGLRHGRLSMAQKRADGGLLGPMDATRIELLDVSLPQLSLISPTQEGRGLVISNYPLDYVDLFGTRDFQGNALPGWEVELYQNNVLLSRQEIGENGRYDFRDIPLYYGSNQFRLEFLGPQGQVRTEYRNLRIDTSHVKPDQRNYVIALGVRDLAPHYSARFEQSIADAISVSAGLAQLQLTELGRQDQFAQLGVTGFAENLLLSSSAALSKSGGNALQLKSQFPYRRASLSIRYTRLNNYSSELFNSRPGVNQIDETLGDISFVVPVNPGVGTTWEIARKRYAEDISSLSLRNRTSTNIGRTYLNHELSYNGGTASTDSSLAGRLEATQLVRRQQLRLGLNYTSTGLQFTDAEIQMRHRNFASSAQLRYYFDGSAAQLHASVSRIFPGATLGGQLSADATGAYSVAGLVSFSIARDPLARRWQIHPEPQAEFGAASIRTFIDNNRNGVMDGTDRPAPEIRLRLHQRNEMLTTDQQGLAFLARLQPHTPMDLSIDQDSLVNPLIRSASDGVRLIPKAGKTTEIWWPLITNGEIDGVVELKNGNELNLLNGMTVHLIDSRGTVLMKTRTDRGGTFFFSSIPPGTYQVTPSFTELFEKQLHSKPLQRQVVIPSEGEIVSGTDFLLER